MNPDLTLEAMSEAARLLREGFDVREKLHAVQKAQDALDGVKAALLCELGVSRSHEVDGASTLNARVRNQLRMNAGQASVLVRNAQAIRDLPLVLRLDHSRRHLVVEESEPCPHAVDARLEKVPQMTPGGAGRLRARFPYSITTSS